MNGRPGGKIVSCPECGEVAYAIVPKESEVVEAEENADGKVWVNCRNCGEQFLVYYRTDV